MLQPIYITGAEEGWDIYNLHQDNENKNSFLFYENRTNRELWQTHMDNAHPAEYVQATKNAIVEFTLDEMTQVG